MVEGKGAMGVFAPANKSFTALIHVLPQSPPGHLLVGMAAPRPANRSTATE